MLVNKIIPPKVFQPIQITIETEEEYKAICLMFYLYYSQDSTKRIMSSQTNLYEVYQDWFKPRGGIAT
jgi:hypothetical protein